MHQLKNWKQVVVFGSSGQLATAFKGVLPSSKTVFLGRPDVDFMEPDSIIAALDDYKPDLIINTSAYTLVDRAEIDIPGATALNSTAVGKIAEWCKERNAFLIHFSTDYVFDGHANTPYRETDPARPINFYGRSKLSGEKLVEQSGAKHLIFRSSWIFHESGHNFIKAMLALGKEKEEIRVVDDQISTPTYATDVALELTKLIDRKSYEKLATGLFHLAGQGYCSRWQLAEAVLHEARKLGMQIKTQAIIPVKTSEFPTPAQRPLYTRLDVSRAQIQLGLLLPTWQNAVRRTLRQLANPQ